MPVVYGIRRDWLQIRLGSIVLVFGLVGFFAAPRPANALGDARARGVALDENGAPLSGAEIRLDKDGRLLGPARTDTEGRWSILRLDPGLWHIVVRASGYLDRDGHIRVGPEVNPETRV